MRPSASWSSEPILKATPHIMSSAREGTIANSPVLNKVSYIDNRMLHTNYTALATDPFLRGIAIDPFLGSLGCVCAFGLELLQLGGPCLHLVRRGGIRRDQIGNTNRDYQPIGNTDREYQQEIQIGNTNRVFGITRTYKININNIELYYL